MEKKSLAKSRTSVEANARNPTQGSKQAEEERRRKTKDENRVTLDLSIASCTERHTIVNIISGTSNYSPLESDPNYVSSSKHRPSFQQPLEGLISLIVGE